MAKVTQFSVSLDNQIGALARLCGVLKRAKINVLAISVSENTDCGWVRLILSPTTVAKTALTKARYQYCTKRVLSVVVSHRPGQLERVTARLARAGVNLDYVYGSNADGPTSLLVLSVDNLAKADKALGG